MLPPIRALLDAIIDYAGLFPPARLPLDQALATYLRHRKGEEAWLVRRFVCPAADLGGLAERIEAHRPPFAIPVAVLGSGGLSLDEFQAGLEADARDMTAFEDRAGPTAILEAYEVRAPRAGLDTALRDLLAFQAISVFVEVPLDESVRETLPALAETEWIGAKGRTGGIEPAAIPSAPALGAFLGLALDLDVEFKLTAGLHEPLRHFDPSLGVPVHGFLNVLVGCLLHLRAFLSAGEWASVLEDEALAGLDVGRNTVSFRGEPFTLADCEEVRDLFAGFGSCSVDEPVEGMRRLGFWGARV